MRVMQQAKKDKLIFLPLGILVLLIIISIIALTPIHTSADTSTSSTAKVNVAVACTLSGSTTTHAVEVLNGAYNDNITGTTLRTICNGSGNYNIYAVGYTNNTEGNNTLYSSTSGTIPTGTTLNGTTSNWAMKLANSTGNTATIENNYNTFQVVPSTSTLVASYNATTSNQTTDSTLQTTYGVSISPNQPAGTYTGAVKYTMNYTEYIPPEYMQDFTLEKCMVNVGTNGNPADVGDEITVYDKRDGNDYTVRYINGECWMTQNLRFTGTSVPTATSNTTADKTLTYYQLDINGTSGGKCYDTTGYSNACIKDSGSTSTGVWYNYYAATAGTVSGSSNSTVASQDICPKNWHLPTGPNTTSGTDFNKLVGNTTSGYQNPTTGLTAFGAVAGGKYYNGALYATGYGLWWSATADTAVTRYYLIYNSSNGQFNGNFNYDRYRYYGYFVRCVRSS